MSAEEPRLQVKRLPEKQVADRAVLDDILASAVVGHLGVIDDGWPYVLPVAYAPWRAGVLLHGSTASRLFRLLSSGARTCFTVTLMDGLVLARSAYNSSMNYRSASLFGTVEILDGEDKAQAFVALTDHLLPGRWEHIRHPSPQEDKATRVLYLPAERWSVKVGAGFADDPAQDVAEYPDLWAGAVGLRTVADSPTADAEAAGVPVPPHVAALVERWT